jgi:hypothetical protein
MPMQLRTRRVFGLKVGPRRAHPLSDPPTVRGYISQLRPTGRGAMSDLNGLDPLLSVDSPSAWSRANLPVLSMTLPKTHHGGEDDALNELRPRLAT